MKVFTISLQFYYHFSNHLSKMLAAMCFYTLEVIFSRKNTDNRMTYIGVVVLERTIISRNHIMKLYHAAFINIHTRKQTIILINKCYEYNWSFISYTKRLKKSAKYFYILFKYLINKMKLLKSIFDSYLVSNTV